MIFFSGTRLMREMPILALIATGISIGLSLHYVSRSLESSDLWTGFLTWRYPLILVIPSILLRFWRSSGHIKGMQSSTLLDNLTYLTLPLAYFISVPPIRSNTHLLYMGIFYLGLLALKSNILIRFLLNHAESKRFNTGLSLFICALWFFSCYAAWLVPVHPLSGDEPHYLLMTHSLIHDYDLNLHDEYTQAEYSAFYKGKLHPKPSDLVRSDRIESQGLGAVFSLVLTPGYLIAGYPGTVAMMVLAAAFLIYQSYNVYLREVSSPRTALIVASALCVVFPIINYSSLIYPDILAACIIMCCLRLFQTMSISRKSKSSPFNLLLLSGILLMLKFRYFPFVLLFFGGVVFRGIRKIRHTFIYWIGFAAVMIVYISIDLYLLHGDLFSRRFGGLYQIQQYLPSWRSIFVLPGFLLDQEAGLLWYSPVFLLTIPGIRCWSHRRDAVHWISLLCLPVTAISLLGHFAWHSLPTPALRYLLPALPPIAIFMCETIHRWRRFGAIPRIMGHIFLWYSIGVSFTLSLIPEWPLNLADGTSHLFEAIDRVIHIPFTHFMPSLIRPSIHTIPWFILLILLIRGMLSWKLQRHPITWAYSIPAVSITLVLATCLSMGVLMVTLPIRSVQMEDRFSANPIGGHYFPAQRDPFFHREYQYGWTLGVGDTLQPALRTDEGRYTCMIRARLVDGVIPEALAITSSGQTSYVAITSTVWLDYSVPVIIPDASPAPLTVQLEKKAVGKVAIDCIDVIPIRSSQWKYWLSLSDLCERFHSPRLQLWAIRNALTRSPGDPWYAFKSQYHSFGALPIPFPGSDSHSLPNDLIDKTSRLALTISIDHLISLERLFGFHATDMVNNDRISEYILRELVYGSNTAFKISQKRGTTGSENHSRNNLILSASHYLDRKMKHAAEAMSEFLLSGDIRPMTIRNPFTNKQAGPWLKPILMDMRDNADYQREAHRLLTTKISHASQSVKNDDIPTSIATLYEVYRLDTAFYIANLPLIPEEELMKIVSQMPVIAMDDEYKLAEGLIKHRKYHAALTHFKNLLETNPTEWKLHVIIARVLFHQGRLEDARDHCLKAMSMTFTDDYPRSLMEIILRKMDEDAFQRGQPPREG